MSFLQRFHIHHFLILLFSLVACEHYPTAFEFQNTPIEGWEVGDTLHYRIDSLGKSNFYKLSLGVRTSAASPYPFQSIWLAVRQQWHNPDTLLTDTIECVLTNKQGDVMGKGISLYTYEQPLRTLSLKKGSSADISIVHIMRREIIRGIANVGIKIEPSN